MGYTPPVLQKLGLDKAGMTQTQADALYFKKDQTTPQTITGDIRASGPTEDSKFMWDESKYAIRAGYDYAADWTPSKMGPYSASFNNSNAEGTGAFSANGSQASGDWSAALGNSEVSGENAFAVGNVAVASGESAIAMCEGAQATAPYAIAIGDIVKATAEHAMTLGGAYGLVLENNIPASLMIGFESDVPTVFVGPGNSESGSLGKVGLGNVTNPQELLTINTSEKIGWESEPGVVDTNLYRGGESTLQTDSDFVANNISAGSSLSGENTGDQDLSSYQPITKTVLAKTDDYTVLETDNGKIITMDSTSAKTFTINDGYAVGTHFTLAKLNTGRVTIQMSGSETVWDSTAGGTLYSYFPSQIGASVTIAKASTTKWIVIGPSDDWTTT